MKSDPSKPAAVPRHIAIIMDGNGRWAQQRGMTRLHGHEQGANSVRACIEACGDLGVRYLTLYAFSQENWLRPVSEVSGLMTLLEKFLDDNTAELTEKNVQLQAIGRLDELPGGCQGALQRSIDATARCDGLTLILALSYSGRAEVIDGIKSVLREVEGGRLAIDGITPEIFSQHLYTRKWPDPDLLIRTSGEMRLSNFLLWQVSYAEFLVTKKLWPDFGRQELIDAVEEFSRRQRRYGAVDGG